MSFGRNPPSLFRYALTREYGMRLCAARPTGGHFIDKIREMWSPLIVTLEEHDKIFASLWISDNKILMGTKNNKLTLLSTAHETYWDQPRIGIPANDPSLPNCKIGIHAIQKNDSGTLIATGGANVNEIGIYDREMSPLYLLKNFHRHCVFDMRWLRDDVLISCSRDARMGIWHLTPSDSFLSLSESFNSLESDYDATIIDSPMAISEALDGSARFRALEYLPTLNTVALVSTKPEVYFFDVESYFGSSERVRAPFFSLSLALVAQECVAIRRWPGNPHFFAIATQRSVITFDIRDGNYNRSLMRQIDNPERFPSCVRSVNFSKDVLSYGTAQGKIYFFDMRMEKHLDYYLDVDKVKLERQTPRDSNLAQEESREAAANANAPNERFNLAESKAVYTHEYNPEGSRLFAAGGPIGTAFRGYFATIWR